MPSPPAPSHVRRDLAAFLREQILAEGVEFTDDSSLRDLGLDSTCFLELILFCERRFGVAVPDSQMTRENLRSVAALADCVCRLGSPGDGPGGGNRP